MVDVNQLDPANLATVAAIVAALVTVLGNAFKLPANYRSLLAIGISFVLVFLPQPLLNKVLTALVIGLMASGVYSQVKPLQALESLEKKKNKRMNKKATAEEQATAKQEVKSAGIDTNNDSQQPIPYDYRPR